MSEHVHVSRKGGVLEIILDKIYKDKEINLENIYYDYNKWDIRQDAEPSLNQLSEIAIRAAKSRRQQKQECVLQGRR